MGGGEGVGSLENIVKELYQQCSTQKIKTKIVVICGRNAALKESLEQQYHWEERKEQEQQRRHHPAMNDIDLDTAYYNNKHTRNDDDDDDDDNDDDDDDDKYERKMIAQFKRQLLQVKSKPNNNELEDDKTTSMNNINRDENSNDVDVVNSNDVDNDNEETNIDNNEPTYISNRVSGIVLKPLKSLSSSLSSMIMTKKTMKTATAKKGHQQELHQQLVNVRQSSSVSSSSSPSLSIVEEKKDETSISSFSSTSRTTLTPLDKGQPALSHKYASSSPSPPPPPCVIVKPLGFVTNMAEYMVAADILLSKAGPGTIAEAAAVGLPILLTSFLPGQEEGNVDFVVQKKFGRYESDNQPKKIANVVVEWLRHPNIMKEMSYHAKKAGMPNAAREIVKCIGKSVLRWKELHEEHPSTS